MALYSFEDVDGVLQSGPLSEGLFRLEQFAENQGNDSLARWAMAELKGWDTIGEQAPDYRKMAVLMVDKVGGPVYTGDGQPMILTLPIYYGVGELEKYENNGMTVLHSDPPRGAGVSLSPDQITTLLETIRYEARRGLIRASAGQRQQPAPRSSYASPDFTTFIMNAELAQLLERRWDEANKDYQAGAHLSTIVMLGGILEAIISDKVLNNRQQSGQANAAPKDKTGKVIPHEEWLLADLINVSYECGWLSKGRRDFAVVLRDYRNYIHPRQQLKQNGHYPDEADCTISWEVVRGAIADLT